MTNLRHDRAANKMVANVTKQSVHVVADHALGMLIYVQYQRTALAEVGNKVDLKLFFNHQKSLTWLRIA